MSIFVHDDIVIFEPASAESRAGGRYPILAQDLASLPPTLMITAGADIMRDDAEGFLHRMQAAAIPVELRRLEGTIHPFLNMGGAIPAATEALDLIAARLRELFN